MKKTIKHFSIAFIAVLMLIAYTFSAFQVSAAEVDTEDTGYSWGTETDDNIKMDVGKTMTFYGYSVYPDCVTKVEITNTNNSVINYYRSGIMDVRVTAIAPGSTTLTIAVTSEYFGPNFTYDMKYDAVHYNITVNQKSEVKVSKVKLNKSSATIYKDNTLRLKATVLPSNADNKKITWSSSNKSVATVNSKGVVKGKKVGTAKITAKSSNGKKATCKVRVKNSVAVKKVKLNNKSANIYAGKTLKLKASISPSNASNKKITWSSNKKSVATVNSKGIVTGKKAGTATITAKSSNGKKATCKVKVKNVAVKKVTLNKKSAKIYVGMNLKLKASISPSNATIKKVTWSSSNKSVATVSSKGVVKGKKAGTATITAKASNGKKATCKVNISRVSTYTLYIKTKLTWLSSMDSEPFVYDKNTGTSYQMIKDQNAYPEVFTAKVPEYVKNVTFYRATRALSNPSSGYNVVTNLSVSKTNNCITLTQSDSTLVGTIGPYVPETRPSFTVSRIYVENDEDWPAVYIYGWGYGLNNQCYPMTNISGTNIWYYDLPETIYGSTDTFFLLKPQGGAEDYDWSGQTEDLGITEPNNCYRLSGSWTTYSE